MLRAKGKNLLHFISFCHQVSVFKVSKKKKLKILEFNKNPMKLKCFTNSMKIPRISFYNLVEENNFRNEAIILNKI